jgi:glycosyltransferase involved in cell wall biosynthesis
MPVDQTACGMTPDSGADDRVLQVVETLDRRGAEVFALELERALVARGRMIRTVALARRSGSLDIPALGSRPRGAPTLWRLRREAHAARVVVAHGGRTLPACVLAMAGMRVPFVYRNIGDPDFWAPTRSRRLRSGVLLRRSALVVAVSAGAAEALVARFGVEPARVRVIPTGVSAARFPPADEEARRRARVRFGLAPNALVALVLGALSPEKEVGAAVDACAALDDIQLLVVGEGAERARLVQHAARVLPGRVCFTGAVQDPESALAAADVLILTSRTEGLPAVAIEAGLTGLPVVATNVGYIRDIVVDGATGYVVPRGDRAAISEAIEHSLRDGTRLGAAARAHCLARFELATVAAAWDRLIEEIATT